MATRYGVIGKPEEAQPELFTEEMAGGARALLVFAPPERGEAFTMVEDLRRSGWRVLVYPAGELAQIVEHIAGEGVEYVTLNPPDRLRKRSLEARQTPIREFVDTLTSDDE